MVLLIECESTGSWSCTFFTGRAFVSSLRVKNNMLQEVRSPQRPPATLVGDIINVDVSLYIDPIAF